MNREEIIQKFPISREVEKLGVKLISQGKKRFMAKCVFHEDGTPSMSIDDTKGLFKCFGCNAGGSVIDFWSKYRGCSVGDVLKEFKGDDDLPPTRNGNRAQHKSASEENPRIEKIYSYENQFGMEIFQVVRMVPKTFRQRHLDDNDNWVWNMEGVTRLLYKLPEVMKADQVWIVEGEKDVETLFELGFTATCNVGGAGKWLDGYTESLTGKEIVICGDNDKAGEQHVELVFESIAGKVKNTRQVKIPISFKDVSDFVASFSTKEDARRSLEALRDTAQVLTKGYNIPLFSMVELEPQFAKHLKELQSSEFDFGRWLPTLGKKVRGLIGGELVTIIADTGVGKTICLTNIAIAARPLPTVVFELELPPELMYERFLSAQTRMDYEQIRKNYLAGGMLGEEGLLGLDHIHICTESKLTPEAMERHINRAEMKTGKRPKVSILDYIQLMQSDKGNHGRRERVSDNAEAMKVLAKTTRTIVVVASQIARKSDDEVEIFLHDAKESGSIENSSGLVLGVWRDPDNSDWVNVKVLKNTKGRAGDIIPCMFQRTSSGEWTSKIVERITKIETEDLPCQR